MNDSNLSLLLQLIARGADLEALLRRGLRYPQISKLLAKAIEEDLIHEEEGTFVLTEKGKENMRSDTITGRPRTDGGWISFAEEFRIRPQGYDKVYLPEPRKSFFKTREVD